MDIRNTDTPACKWSTSRGPCGRTETTRPYAGGPRCAEHTPARLAGRPEPGDTEIRPLPFPTTTAKDPS